MKPKTLLRSIFPLLILGLGTACTQAPTTTPIRLPTLTVRPAGASSPTPVVVTATPVPPVSFNPGLPADVQISEYDLSLDFKARPADLTTGLYTLYLTREAGDYTVWMKSGAGESKKVVTCRKCPVSFFQLYSAELRTDTPWITISVLNPSGENELVVIDPLRRSAHLFGCRLHMTRPDTCRPVVPTRGGGWVGFSAYPQGITAPVRYFLYTPGGKWETISGPLLDSGRSAEDFWTANGTGFAFTGRPDECQDYPSLRFVSVAAHAWEDWSALPCRFPAPGAIFAGLSPDGSQAAFIREKPAGDGSQDGQPPSGGLRQLESISVCPLAALEAADPNRCRQVAADLGRRMWYFFPGAPGDGRGGLVSTLQWLDDSRFLWVSYGEMGSNRTWVGTIDLDDHIRILLQEGQLDGFRLSPDRGWLIYRQRGETWVYHSINLQDGTDLALELPEQAFEATWLSIP